MLEHAASFAFSEAEEFDVIVVGSGAVGMTCAQDLVERGLRVALLEAGPSKPTQSSQIHFQSATASAHQLPGLHVGRFRCLGGTTNFWGGQLVPFAPMVFKNRPWVSEAEWPITHKDIAPFYERALIKMGMENVLRNDAEVWQEIGVSSPPKTNTIHPIFTRWTPESNFAIHFRQDLQTAHNLTVLLEAQVGALVTDDTGAVRGVEVCMPQDRREILSGRQVVLANGTIEISRLLLMPDHQGRATPWAENRWIGRGFLDHVDCYAGSIVPMDKKKFSDLFDNVFIDGLKYSPKLRLSDEIQEKEQLLEVSSHFVFNSSVSENIQNLKILIKGLMKGRLEKSAFRNPLVLLGALKFIFPMAVRYVKYRRMMNFSDGGIQLRLTSEQAALFDSQISLRSGDVDSFGMPRVDVAWKISPDTLETLAKFGEYLRDYLEENNLATVTLDARLAARDPAFLDQTDDANHQMGGARMATSEKAGVVDENGAVFGTQNLYVAGAATYPSSGFANPTFTAIALGLRLADHLSQKHREPPL